VEKMELSLLVARILSLIYIAAGIAALSSKMNFSRILEDFERSPGLTYISGFIALIFGMVLITYHNNWVNNWTVLVTIIGWISVIKGVMLILWPQFISYFKGMYKNNKILGLIMLALGLLFGYFGFIV
jgi:uncharacterized membrane protein